MKKYTEKDIEIFLSNQKEIKQKLLEKGINFKDLNKDFLLDVCDKELSFIEKIIDIINEKDIEKLLRKKTENIYDFVRRLDSLLRQTELREKFTIAFAEIYLNPFEKNHFKNTVKEVEETILYNFYKINWLDKIVDCIKYSDINNHQHFIKICEEKILEKLLEDKNVNLLKKHLTFKIDMLKKYESDFLVNNLENINNLIKEKNENNDVILHYIIKKDLFEKNDFKKMLINEILEKQKEDNNYFIKKIFSFSNEKQEKLLKIKEIKEIFRKNVKENLSFLKIINETKMIKQISGDELKQSVLNDLTNNEKQEQVQEQIVIKLLRYISGDKQQNLLKEWLKNNDFLEKFVENKNNITLLTENNLKYNPVKHSACFSDKSIKEIKEIIIRNNINDIIYVHDPHEDLLKKVNEEDPNLIKTLNLELIKNSHSKKFIFSTHPEIAERFTEKELLEYYPSSIFIEELKTFFKDIDIKKMKEIYITKDENLKQLNEIEFLIDKILIEKNKNMKFKV